MHVPAGIFNPISIDLELAPEAQKQIAERLELAFPPSCSGVTPVQQNMENIKSVERVDCHILPVGGCFQRFKKNIWFDYSNCTESLSYLLLALPGLGAHHQRFLGPSSLPLV